MHILQSPHCSLGLLIMSKVYLKEKFGPVTIPSDVELQLSVRLVHFQTILTQSYVWGHIRIWEAILFAESFINFTKCQLSSCVEQYFWRYQQIWQSLKWRRGVPTGSGIPKRPTQFQDMVCRGKKQGFRLIRCNLLSVNCKEIKRSHMLSFGSTRKFWSLPLIYTGISS